MKPVIYTIGGETDWNDGVYCEAIFEEAGGFFTLPSSTRDFTDVSFHEPVPGEKTFEPWEFSVRFFPMSTTYAGQREALQAIKGRFRPQNARPSETLVVADVDDGDKLWAVAVTVTDQPEQLGSSVLVTFQADRPYLVSEDLNENTFSITASGDTTVVTNNGTMPAHPRLRFSPSGTKGAGFVWRAYVRLVNQMADKEIPAGKYSYDLGEDNYNTAALVNNTTVSNQINQVGGVTAAAGQTCPVDTAVGGGLPSSGMAYCGTEQFYYTIAAGVMTWVTRGIGGTTAATHPDNAVIARSDVLANGDDFRVFVDGREVDRWLDGFNTTTTKVWINLPAYDARAFMNLSGSLAAGGTTSVTILNTPSGVAAFDKMPVPGEFVIGNDRFSYTGKNRATLTFTGVKQGIKDTTAAVHNPNDIVRLLQHDIMFAFGNMSLSAPSTDDTKKPAIDLATSTNLSHVYTSVYNGSGLQRGLGWTPALVQNVAGFSGEYYTAARESDPEAEADPFSVMGSQIMAYESAGKWLAGTAGVVWSIDHPAGVTTVTWSGRKYRVSTKWPKTAAFQKSLDGKKWTSVANEATPASAAAWADLTAHSSVSLGGTYRSLRFFFSGTGSAVANDKYLLSVTAVTFVVDSANVPTVVRQSPSSIYEVSGTLYNDTNGKAVAVSFVMDYSQTLECDTEEQTVTYLKDGTPVFYAVQPVEVSFEWFPVEPGANTLRWVETGVTGFSIDVDFYERSSP